MANNRTTITVLLVEDNLADQKLTERAFKKSKKSIELKIVDNGLDAISYLQHLPPFDNKIQYPTPDIILLDINMPGLDGKQTLRRIRNSLDIPFIPVIMLTTSNEERDILDSYKLGANSYVTKPQNMTDFQIFIENMETFWFDFSQLPYKH
jgi:CheY-like chemotaxis protein